MKTVFGARVIIGIILLASETGFAGPILDRRRGSKPVPVTPTAPGTQFQGGSTNPPAAPVNPPAAPVNPPAAPAAAPASKPDVVELCEVTCKASVIKSGYAGGKPAPTTETCSNVIPCNATVVGWSDFSSGATVGSSTNYRVPHLPNNPRTSIPTVSGSFSCEITKRNSNQSLGRVAGCQTMYLQ